MKRVLLLVVCMVFLMAGMAQADWLELLVPGGTSVTIYDPYSAGLVPTFAGPYTVNFGPSSSDYQSYQAFCVDPAFIDWNTWYDNYTMIPVPNSRRTTRLRILLRITPALLVLTAQPLRLAVWEVVFQQLSGGTN